jgi:hypothetical protein
MKLMLGLLLLLVGCNKTTPPLLQLEMYGNNQAALYIVQQNGGVAFGGGMNALSGVITWRGQLTELQFMKLQVLLDAELENEPSTNRINRYVITVFTEESREKRILPLTNTNATELYYFLEEATLSRIQAHLDALPKPSMEVISDRVIKGTKE